MERFYLLLRVFAKSCFRQALTAALAVGIGILSAPLSFLPSLFITTAHAAPLQPGDPPYEKEMQRLSEILGALHYLGTLCQRKDAATWRQQMNALIEGEQSSVQRRARLIQSFNRGITGFREHYQYCTPSAETAIERYLIEGADLTFLITSRYGN